MIGEIKWWTVSIPTHGSGFCDTDAVVGVVDIAELNALSVWLSGSVSLNSAISLISSASARSPPMTRMKMSASVLRNVDAFLPGNTIQNRAAMSIVTTLTVPDLEK